MSSLHDFLSEAQVLLIRAQECLQHLELIGHDADACDCLLKTLASLVSQAKSHSQPQIAGFCEHLRQLLEPTECHDRLQDASLNALQACLVLVEWQLELIDPHTGKLSLDNQEQLELLDTLSATLKVAPSACTACIETAQPCDHSADGPRSAALSGRAAEFDR
ncbi:histidine kinase [Pseudomonas fontis]|uniref:Histidine kinase n=1 Tax=Pseudomonas fontis TaxID=2942633 RepID=A0ABT5NVZ6_9PSED|nr:histidine kinase [Pseudomonas fontis]MDD0976833.1 histidine kinase [Pseudomonas fontis]MDD0992357.1 histidine kinase [Pseudomonas fontis]